MTIEAENPPAPTPGKLFLDFFQSMASDNSDTYLKHVRSINSADKPPVSNEERQQLEEYLIVMLIPQLAENPHPNSFRLAVALSFADSRQLDPITRKKIGLSPEPKEKTDAKPPILFGFDAFSHLHWKTLCSTSENLMQQNMAVGSSSKKALLGLMDCLRVKTIGTRAGLCYETREFSNGTVFIEGVWYLARTASTQSRLIAIEDSFAKGLKFPEGEEAKIIQNRVYLKSFGGVWQAARPLNQPNSQTLVTTTRQERKKFLQGKLQDS